MLSIRVLGGGGPPRPVATDGHRVFYIGSMAFAAKGGVKDLESGSALRNVLGACAAKVDTRNGDTLLSITKWPCFACDCGDSGNCWGGLEKKTTYYKYLLRSGTS
jgi:hypothetical protein